jgi:hypothetical protein
MQDEQSVKLAFQKILIRSAITILVVVVVIVGLGVWKGWPVKAYGDAFFFGGLFVWMAVGLTLGSDRPGGWIGGSMFMNLQRVVTRQEVDPEGKEQVEGFLNAYRTPIFLFLAGLLVVLTGVMFQAFP